MSIPQSYVGVSGDMCSCGRRASIRHCPECGSFRLTFKRKVVDEIPIDSFHCVRCGVEFNDEMGVQCEAPVHRSKQQIATLEILRVKQERLDHQPLTQWEKQFLDSVDLMTGRYKTQSPRGEVEELKSVETPLKIAEDIRQRLAREYALICLKNRRQATVEGRDEYIERRILDRELNQ